MNYFTIAEKRAFLSSYGLATYPFCKSVMTEGGIEVQEYLNHHSADNICIVSDQEDIRPLGDYRLRSSTFFLLHKIHKVLQKPYQNKMEKQNRNSRRKQF